MTPSESDSCTSIRTHTAAHPSLHRSTFTCIDTCILLCMRLCANTKSRQRRSRAIERHIRRNVLSSCVFRRIRQMQGTEDELRVYGWQGKVVDWGMMAYSVRSTSRIEVMRWGGIHDCSGGYVEVRRRLSASATAPRQSKTRARPHGAQTPAESDLAS